MSLLPFKSSWAESRLIWFAGGPEASRSEREPQPQPRREATERSPAEREAEQASRREVTQQRQSREQQQRDQDSQAADRLLEDDGREEQQFLARLSTLSAFQGKLAGIGGLEPAQADNVKKQMAWVLNLPPTMPLDRITVMGGNHYDPERKVSLTEVSVLDEKTNTFLTRMKLDPQGRIVQGTSDSSALDRIRVEHTNDPQPDLARRLQGLRTYRRELENFSKISDADVNEVKATMKRLLDLPGSLGSRPITMGVVPNGQQLVITVRDQATNDEVAVVTLETNSGKVTDAIRYDDTIQRLNRAPV